MKTWREKITVLAVSKSFKDKLTVCGVNDEGKWRRINNLSHYDLIDGKKASLKLFGRSEITCYFPQTKIEDCFDFPEQYRPEDCCALKDPTPTLLNEIKFEDRNLFVKNYLDGGVYESFRGDRTIGLIKPLIEEVYFGWNSLFQTFESTFVFQDKTGQRFKMICIDLKWYYSWIYLFQKKKELLYEELSQLPLKLNNKDTVLVIGLTKPVLEVPGGFNGCWPVVYGIHAFKS